MEEMAAPIGVFPIRWALVCMCNNKNTIYDYFIFSFFFFLFFQEKDETKLSKVRCPLGK